MQILYSCVLLGGIFWYGIQEVTSKDVREKKERITNGTITLMTLYPFVASIIFHGSHKCGASIISKIWILTAGHCCFYNGEMVPDTFMQVSVGNMYWEDGDYYRVEKKFVHENYDSQKLINDIALLKMKTAIKFGLSVSPISLHQFEINDKSEDRDAVVMGWGLYTDSSGNVISSASDQLQHVVVKVVPLDNCKRYYSDVSTNNLCAFGGNSKGSCQGDSGGPLVMRINKLVQIGIVSYGADCDNIIPEVYTSIHTYYPWIKGIIRRERPVGRKRVTGL